MMSRLCVVGGNPLSGEIRVSGMKNAALPILFATVLCGEKCVLENIPDVGDVAVTLEILQKIGAEVKHLDENTVEIDTRHVEPMPIPASLTSRLRGSSYLLGSELGRFGKSRFGIPGGCDFGKRPLDFHFRGLEKLGAIVTKNDDEISATAPDGLRGNHIRFEFASVGATANLMLAAVLAEGDTVIEQAAKEPHIVDLANFLISCGAEIKGAGNSVILIHGVKKLHGCRHFLLPDMIEGATFLTAAAMTGGKLTVSDVYPAHLRSVTDWLEKTGVTVEKTENSVTVERKNGLLRAVGLETAPYPGFPTDMHPQAGALLCMAKGTARICETVWGNRFRYLEEFCKFGAICKRQGDCAFFRGVDELSAASAVAIDLRAGAALLLMGLAAKGETVISGAEYIDRGYCKVVEKFRSVGGDVTRTSIP